MSVGAREGKTMTEIRKIPNDAAWAWLGAGASDFGKASLPCILYGIVFALLSTGLAYLLFHFQLLAWVFALAGGFLLVAPLFATGLYEAARMLERGQKPTLGAMLRPAIASPLQLAYLGVVLALLYMAWARLAQFLYAMFSNRTYQGLQDFTQFLISTPQGLSMAIIGTIIGGVIAALAFSVSAISAPMLLDRKTDLFTAMAASLKSVQINPPAMILWAMAIASLTAMGIATFFIGLAFVFPLVGLATWHAYRALVASSDSPAGAALA